MAGGAEQRKAAGMKEEREGGGGEREGCYSRGLNFMAAALRSSSLVFCTLLVGFHP